MQCIRVQFAVDRFVELSNIAMDDFLRHEGDSLRHDAVYLENKISLWLYSPHRFPVSVARKAC